MHKGFLFCCLILFPCTLFGQKVWTLEECIVHAHEHNLEIQQAVINQKISEEIVTESRGNLIPSVNGSANHNYNWGRTIDPFTNQFTTNQVRSNNFSLFASVTLFNGFQIRNTIKQSEYESMAAQYDVDLLKTNVGLSITSIYLQILFTQELAEVAENQKMLTEEQLERMKKLVAAGKLSPVVLPDLEAQLASEEVRLVNTRNQLRVHYLNLALLMNVDPEEPMQVLKPELISVPDTATFSNTEALYQKALETQPQIKGAEYRKLGSVKSWEVAKGRMSPRLTLNGSLSTLYASSSRQLRGYEYSGAQFIGLTSASDSVFAPSYEPLWQKKSFNDQFNDNLNKFAGFTLTVPILNNLQVRSSIARAKLGIQYAEVNLQIQKNNLQRTIIAAHVDAVNARKRMDASQVAVRASEEALRNAEKRMEVGQINSFDYAQVKNRWAQSQSDLLQAKYDFVFRSKILDFYRGNPLKL